MAKSAKFYRIQRGIDERSEWNLAGMGGVHNKSMTISPQIIINKKDNCMELSRLHTSGATDLRRWINVGTSFQYDANVFTGSNLPINVKAGHIHFHDSQTNFHRQTKYQRWNITCSYWFWKSGSNVWNWWIVEFSEAEFSIKSWRLLFFHVW